MDRGAVVDPPPAAAAMADAEQAVFTSLPSPMGRGYRIVAASAGLAADEKKEITQRAPSHGSLCDPSPAAVGLASFRLRSGRHCLFIARHAGIEQSARGGYRVYTHVVVLDAAVFRRFQCDPLRVEAAALPTTERLLKKRPPGRLSPLSLCLSTGACPEHKSRIAPLLPASDVERVASILAAVLDGRRLLVSGAPAPKKTLRCLLWATPTFVRERFSLSYGLRFAPARAFQLVFVDVTDVETEGKLRGQDVELFEWSSASSPRRSPFDGWLRLVRARWESGRHVDLERLTAQLTEEHSAHALGQLAMLATDIERIGNANRALLDQLIGRHAHVRPASKVHARLLAQFKKATSAREEALTRQIQPCVCESSPPGPVHP